MSNPTKVTPTNRSITPFLWFDDQAEEAANFYVSIFNDSKILDVTRYGSEAAKVSGRQEGSVMTVAFQIEGQVFTALNGGPHFNFTPAISFAVNCETQEELDALWDRLTEDGEELPCGWLTDKYGVSWQLFPSALMDMIKDPDTAKSERVANALFQMKKIDIAALQRAYAEG